MRLLDRRHLMKTAVGAAAAVATGPWLESSAVAAEPKRIKVGQIGIGHEHASEKMKTFRKLSDHYEVVGVVESDPKLRKEREKYPAYKDLAWMTEEELLNTKGLEAVAVEVDSDDKQILPVLERCIDAGMHVHLDKPAGESFSEFKRIMDKASKRNLTVQLGYMYRNHPTVKFCRHAVKEGWLGQVFEVDCVMAKFSPLKYRKYLSQFRGGTMFVYASHMIDLVVSLLGGPDRLVPFKRQTRTDVGVEMCDNGLIVFEYPKTTATIRVSSLEVDGWKRRQLVVCGDQGTIDIRPLEQFGEKEWKLRLALAKAAHSYKKNYQDVGFPPPPGRYDKQLVELARIIRGEMDNPFPPEHELIVQKCLLEACGYPV